MSVSAPNLDELVSQALRLSPKERIQLIERVASSVEREMETPLSQAQAPTEHWGQALNRLLDTLDMSDWEALDIDDPVEWVKQQRRDEQKRRLGDWGIEE